jgi:perosamine synthetase
MLVVHYAGQPAQVEQLAAAAGVGLERVVEDAAHAVGTWVGERPVGTISAATCFSFYATKNLPIGEGGMVTTADPRLAGYVQRARLHGMDRDAWKRYRPGSAWRYEVDLVGLKANMTDLQAAIGRGQLLHLRAWQRRREELARRYDRQLAGITGIRVPARPADGRHAWHLYVIGLDPAIDRDTVMRELARRGVSCSVHFTPLHQLACYRHLAGPGEGWLPNADAAAGSILSLPLYPSLSDRQLDLVCRELASLCRGP